MLSSSSIKDQMAMRQVEEKEFMTEWSETRIKIEDWLSNADGQAGVFEVPRDNIIEVEEQVAEHEVLLHLFLYGTDLLYETKSCLQEWERQ